MMDYFAVLELPRACEVDLQQLESHYRRLQQAWHPDRKASEGEAQRAAALQKTSLINDAHAALKSPLRRAAHLLELQGRDVSEAKQSQLDPAFLLQQMALRDHLESLERAGDLDGLSSLLQQARADFAVRWAEFVQQFEAGDFESAQRCYYALQFQQRFVEEVRAAEDRLLD